MEITLNLPDDWAEYSLWIKREGKAEDKGDGCKTPQDAIGFHAEVVEATEETDE